MIASNIIKYTLLMIFYLLLIPKLMFAFLKEKFYFVSCFPDFRVRFLFVHSILGNTDEKCSTLSRQHSRGSHKPKLITLPVDSASLHQRK